MNFALIFAGLIACFGCAHATGDTLVLLDNLVIKETHSIFFKSLADRGYKLTFKLADDPAIILARFGEYLYKNVILFAPAVDEFGGELSVERLVEFVDDGGNVLVALNEDSGAALRQFAVECGLEVDAAGASVIDHLHFDAAADAGDHSTLLVPASNLIQSPIIIGDAVTAPLLYRGTGLLVSAANPLVLRLLTADSTAYAHSARTPIRDYPHAIGRQTVLIGGIQARNNARVVFSGSLHFFADATLASPTLGNRAAANALAAWTFGETGRLRVAKITHHRAGEQRPPVAYTINELVVYTIEIQELVGGEWRPFRAADIQLEFVRIDPFVRVYLQPSGGGRYEAKFRIPDVYGVFQFKVNYKRLGYAQLESATQVSVRPMQHNQYERFIPGAYPYYMSAFSMVVGVFVFAFVFLHFKEEAPDAAQQKMKLKVN